MLAITIASLTLMVFAAFGIHVFNAGEYEQRTVIAMTIRSLLWSAIAITCWRQLLRQAV